MTKATDIGSLVASLGLDDATFHKDLKKAAAGIGSFSSKSNKQLAKAELGWKKMSGSLTSFVSKLNPATAAIGLIGGPAGFGLLVSNSMKATAEIERNAKIAGLSTTAYQEMAYAAGQYQVSVDALTDGMKELSLRGDEFVKTGGGSAADSFQRLGYNAENLNTLLSDTPGLMTDIIGRMEGLDKAAQIRIADEIFGGTGGEQFVAMIQAGARSFDEMRSEAHRLGAVLDEDVVKQSAAAKKNIENLTKVLSTNFQNTVATLAPDISKISTSMTEWIAVNQDFISSDIPSYIKSFAKEVGVFVNSNSFQKLMQLSKHFGLLGFLNGMTALPALPEQLKNVQKDIAALEKNESGNGVFNEYHAKRLAALKDREAQLKSLISKPVDYSKMVYAEDTWVLPDFNANRRPQFVNYDAVNMTDKERRMMSVDKSDIAQAKKWLDDRKNVAEQAASDWKEKHEQMYADAKRMSDLTEYDTYRWGQTMSETADKTAENFESAFSGWASSFSGTLNDMLWESDATFGDIAKSFGKMATQMTIQQQVVQPFVDAVGPGIGSFFSGMFSGSFDPFGLISFHGGGIAGSGEGNSIYGVNPGIFAGAPRFHSGLMPDEFPAILQKGEGVFTQEQMKAMGKKTVNNISISVPVTFEPSGDPAADIKTADRLVSQLKSEMRGMIRDEMRVGGALNPAVG